MSLKNLFSSKKPVISFEIFPPNKASSINTIYKTIDNLAVLNPDYISVTYGAGGSLVDNKTIEIASIIKNQYNIEPLAHLTCVTSTKKDINYVLEKLQENNVENILALRGDLPEDDSFEFPNPLHFTYASDLINHIKNNKDFCIAAACYPEAHIDCKDLNTDLKNLKNKVDIGVDFLITQLFFDNKFYYDFEKRARALDIKTPIEVGIMPVVNKKQIERIVKLCGASLPEKFIKIMNKYENNPEALKDAGIAYAVEQIVDLLSSGVSGIHIYTMNKPDIAKRIVDSIYSIVKAIERSN
ncbi:MULTISPECIES: methylenetetrahydrofolate reductase [NAD(P)H] [Clostridium]|mgnify:CR=1 FL=1|uniref:Methylenetetrahydrofolate reductase n=1 Tax=Clostridium acetireducens DSM 10703 TaxID=1121290 RepID=A0A1E8EYW3_9CLOT|nr:MULTISPECIES: methylenetetrahydrofolate reductase [NAD(P)H] [Clostridium]NMA57470.1 methylenetetrahydrofolate reductase [NAD(P)H] [Clostridium cochlearium]OFI06053.1 5,10-methylenetetrahydrofolate reductase [Clostridium acetireducens DSM 10703]